MKCPPISTPQRRKNINCKPSLKEETNANINRKVKKDAFLLRFIRTLNMHPVFRFTDQRKVEADVGSINSNLTYNSFLKL